MARQQFLAPRAGQTEAEAILIAQNAQRGHINVGGDVLLPTAAGTANVLDDRCSIQSVILFMPPVLGFRYAIRARTRGQFTVQWDGAPAGAEVSYVILG